MMKSLVIMLAGLLLLSLAPEGLCLSCDVPRTALPQRSADKDENCPSSRAMLPFRHHHDHHQNITVNYTVVNSVDHSFRDSISVTVPKNSFFFNVMESAQKQDSAKFSFNYTLSVWGAYITAVRGLAADVNQRTYWQLLSNGIPLKLGAGCYEVSHRERLEVRFSTY